MRPDEELAQLIADQEKDLQTGDRVWSTSLDAPTAAEGDTTWGDLVVAQFEGVPGTTKYQGVRRRAVATDSVHGTYAGYIKGCRCDRCSQAARDAKRRQRAHGPIRAKHGTQTMYSLYSCRCDLCVQAKSLYEGIRKLRKRRTHANPALLGRLREAVDTYIAGARIIDVATMIYEDCGYASPESCYQELRRMLHAVRAPVRPPRWQHGHLSSWATEEERRQYGKAQTRKQRERRHENYTRCTAINNRDKKRCQRYAPKEIGLCEHHRREHPVKWTEDKIAKALLSWVEEHGEIPTARLWRATGDGPPNVNTMYNRCGNWATALALAGLQSRRPDSPRMNRGTPRHG